MSKELPFTIEPKIFKGLLAIQERLPEYATGEDQKDSEVSYDDPAALALLGVKGSKLDTIVELNMSGGCWDAPNINHDDMDIGFREMIDTKRIVAGMCLIRHNNWSGDYNTKSGLMPSHMKSQIHQMRNTFKDITQTVWIVLHKGYFRLYRPSRSTDGKVGISEIESNYILRDHKDDTFVKAKLAKDALEKKTRQEAAKKKADDRKHKAELALIKQAEKEKREIQKQSQAKAISKEIEKDFREAIKDTIKIGNGMSYIKSKKGKYILWLTG